MGRITSNGVRNEMSYNMGIVDTGGQTVTNNYPLQMLSPNGYLTQPGFTTGFTSEPTLTMYNTDSFGGRFTLNQGNSAINQTSVTAVGTITTDELMSSPKVMDTITSRIGEFSNK